MFFVYERAYGRKAIVVSNGEGLVQAEPPGLAGGQGQRQALAGADLFAGEGVADRRDRARQGEVEAPLRRA